MHGYLPAESHSSKLFEGGTAHPCEPHSEVTNFHASKISSSFLIILPSRFELIQEWQFPLSLLHLTGGETVNEASHDLVWMLCLQVTGTEQAMQLVVPPSIFLLPLGQLCGSSQEPIISFPHLAQQPIIRHSNNMTSVLLAFDLHPHGFQHSPTLRTKFPCGCKSFYNVRMLHLSF